MERGGLSHLGLFGPRRSGERQAGTAHALTRSFEFKCLPVVAERMWLRRRPFLEGAKGAGHGQQRFTRRNLAKEEEASDDTVFTIGKMGESEKGKQPSVLECGSTA